MKTRKRDAPSIKKRLVAACAAVWLLFAASAYSGDLAGRYVVASLPSKPGASVADTTYGGVVDIVAHGHSYGVNWHLTTETRKLRGLGLLVDDDLLGVSLATGGIAYGVAIYHHDADEHRWRGRWITSIDSGGTSSEISFDDDGSDRLPGRHRLRCSRPGAGGFDGSVSIEAEGADYRLSFAADGASLYRGAGILLDDGRLVVGWSFGSAPAVAAYQIGTNGLFTGHRFSLRGGHPAAAAEYLAKSGDDAARLLPSAARIDPALMPADVDAGIEPDAPEVKTWVYDELMDRYNADGWAERWLEGQLTSEEHALLERAVHRRKRRSGRNQPASRPTIGDLIEQERNRADD